MVTFGTATCRRSVPERERADAKRSQPGAAAVSTCSASSCSAKVTVAVRAEDRF